MECRNRTRLAVFRQMQIARPPRVEPQGWCKFGISRTGQQPYCRVSLQPWKLTRKTPDRRKEPSRHRASRGACI